MLIEVEKLVKEQVELNLPFYFVDSVGYNCKAYEDYCVLLHKDGVKICEYIWKTSFSAFNNIGRFIERQEELKAEFEAELAQIIEKVTK